MFNNKILENERILILVKDMDKMKDFIEATEKYLIGRQFTIFKIFNEENRSERESKQLSALMEMTDLTFEKKRYLCFGDYKNKSLNSDLDAFVNLVIHIENEDLKYTKNRYGVLEKYPVLDALADDLGFLSKKRTKFEDYKTLTNEEKELIELYYSY